MMGSLGFEPRTSASSVQRSPRLSYEPVTQQNNAAFKNIS